MLNHSSYKAVLTCLLIGLSSNAAAFGDQWFLGVGGGGSRIQPLASESSITRKDDIGKSAVVYFGRDIDDRSSAQVQIYSLGDAIFSNDEEARYMAGDASVLYRFYDTRDNNPGSTLATSLYGRFGLGIINRESDIELSNDVPVYFGAGAGVETYLTEHLGLRLEANYHEADTASASLSLVGRFGGKTPGATPMTRAPFQTAPPPSTTSADPQPTTPNKAPQSTFPSVPGSSSPVATLPGTPSFPQVNAPTAPPATADTRPEVWVDPMPDVDRNTTRSATMPSVEIMTEIPRELPNTAMVQGSRDTDNDGVQDTIDQCSQSLPGYPVDGIGCPMFNHIASEVQFIEKSASLTSGSLRALSLLSTLLKQYPTARVELVTHTDNSDTEDNQSSLTRQRLRTMGMYLVKEGISQDRLLLRSYGSKRPVFDNSTAEGRRRNNRVEVLEYPEQQF